MKAKCVSLFVFLISVNCLAQSTIAPSPSSEDDLVHALLSTKTGEERAALALLKDHKNLVTRRVCDSLLQSATVSSALGDHSRSLFLCEIAREAATQLDDKKLLAFAVYRIGRDHFAQSDIKTAIQDYLQSKRILEEAGARRDLIYVLAELGTLHVFAADYPKAEEYCQESLTLAAAMRDSKEPPGALPDEYGTAFAWSNLGHVARWRGDHDEALHDFQRSLALWKELRARGYWSAGNVIDALLDIAHVYQAIGNHMQALNYLSQGMELSRTLIDRGRMAAVLNDMGVLYIEQADYGKAAQLVNESLTIFERLHNRREVARNLSNLGVIYFRERKYEAALQEFQRSLKITEEIDAVELMIAVQEGLGSVYQAQGDYPMALKWFETGWSRAKTIGDKVRMTEILWREGQVFYLQGDYSRSTVAAQSAVDLATRLSSPLLTYLALTLEGESQQAQKADGLASQAFIKAIDTAEYMRGQVAGAEKEQQLFFENKVAPYHSMVGMLIGQGRAENALSYAERAKARVLLDVLRNGRMILNKSLSQAEQSDERRLYSEMVSLNTQIRAERMSERTDEARLGEMDGRLQKARGAYEAFQAALYAAHPDLKAKRGLVPPFRMEDAEALLPDTRTAILEYVATSEETFLFVLARNPESPSKVEIKVASIRIKKTDLSNQVDQFRRLMSTNHPGFRQADADLYDLLVKPAEPFLRGKDTVCIVPDGPLWNLPFQALLATDDKYLLELYAIYYAPSIQALREMRKRSESLQSSPAGTTEGTGHLLRKGNLAQLYAIGNPAFGGEAVAQAIALRKAPFVPLPETEQEVRVLADEVYGREVSLIRVGASAREDTIKAEVGKYSVLHFAAHGVLDDRNPLYSYIVLAPSVNSQEDGLLEAWEFMQMDLKAELVVLSACDTARGRVGEGEGMIGMTWALLVAGVATTVASQWQVPSQSTTRLMVAFHKNLTAVVSGKKVSKAEAWRKAALRLIADPRYRMKPYYWAGFVVVGDGGR